METADHDDTMEHCGRDHTDLPFLCSVDVVPAPKNLQFSDVTQTSFRATWEHGAPDVALYRIGWSKKGENDFKYVSKNHLCRYCLMVPTETALALLSGQRRQRGHGKCRLLNHLLGCNSSVLMLQQFSPSHALCLCFPRQDILNNDETSYLLEDLEIDTPYDVSVTAIYPDEAESEDLLGTERTCKRNNGSCEMVP